ncbi:DUF7482 domain-containing protein [Mucilaginibacter gilvus]|uniref:DUF7482 domain-containing protein n=1 Tax=Mucilaginibacter gilvus TaxID=2305909 RepID=A0A444MND8_9SPHI|nr:hypothetical protein [Mucilaginibacter gilvus]RWY51221.1 hypothetical protein EPL05_14260 [Mucilaginibacter gilvus]
MKNINFPQRSSGLSKTKFLLGSLVLISLGLYSFNKMKDYTPEEHLTGVPALSGMLDKSKFTMSSIISVDLYHNTARFPLFKGSFKGKTVWYVRTDVSDEQLAKELGLNFSPRLANAGKDCPFCVQSVQSAKSIPGATAVEFAGTVDFSPMRKLVPGPKGFLPMAAEPGSVAGPGYSDLIQVKGSNIVYNAPIVATGDGPLDVSPNHTNTLDRVTAIDTRNMTVDLQFIRAFSHGKDIFYLSFSASDPGSAVIERGTFIPAMASLPFGNDPRNPNGSRSSIFAFANGKLGKNDPNAQGLAHVILDNPPGGLSTQNPALFESLRKLGDARNILGSFPTLKDKQERELYSPLWDLNVCVWSDETVAKKMNYAQTDANTITQLAAKGYITNPGGGKLGSANIVVNCPVIGFATSAPQEAQAPRVTN